MAVRDIRGLGLVLVLGTFRRGVGKPVFVGSVFRPHPWQAFSTERCNHAFFSMTQRWDVDEFVSLPRWKIRWNASPVEVTDDSDDSESCLITMQEVSSLSHTVQASDGRTYDALGLQEWLRRAPESSVIPGCPITYVDLVPFHRALARRTRAAWSRLAHRVNLAWHLSRFKKRWRDPRIPCGNASWK